MKTPITPVRGSLLAAALFLVSGISPVSLSAAQVVLSLGETGAINGQLGWSYNPGTGLRSSGVRGEPGGLFHVADDGGILPAGPRHFFTQAGLGENAKMNNFASRPVTLSGTTYVRLVVRMESRTPGVFGTDPNEFFFGFAGGGSAGGGFPAAFAALKIPFGGTGGGVETVADGGAALYPDSRVALDDTLFVVARFNVNGAGNLTGVDVWLDPVFADGATPDHSTVLAEPGPLVIGDPSGPAGENASFRFRAQNMPMRLDNLAIGTSWADVVPPAYTGPSPRPPVVLAAPQDVVGMLGEEWTARAVLVQNPAEAASVSVGPRETVAIFLVDSPAQVTGYQWMFNTGIAIPAGSGGTLASMPFILHTGIQVGNPVRLPLGETNSLLAARVMLASGNLQTVNARLTEAPSTEIITQPVGRTVLDGDRFSLSVIVESPFDLTYQWFGPAGAISGATDRVLTFNPARVADTGEYYVVVTDETGVVLESARVLLTVGEFVMPSDARVVRLFPNPFLGANIEFDGIEDTQLGEGLSPHPFSTEPPTVPSIPRGLFNARIAEAYFAGRGGVYDFSLETAELAFGVPRPTGPGAEVFLPFDYPVLRDGSNNLVRDAEGNLQFNNTLEPSAGLGYIGAFLLNLGARDIRVVPTVRNSGGFGDGYAGRETAQPNYIEVTGLLPHPSNFLLTDPFPLARIVQHVPSGSEQITSSPPYMLNGASYLELTFEPEDLIHLAGFVFINRNYFQAHRATKAFPDKPNVRATATFTDGNDRIDLISTGFTFQGDDGPGLGQNTFFGFESPAEGYYLERIEVWALGNNFRLLFDIDDLAVAVEAVPTEGGFAGWMDAFASDIPANLRGPFDDASGDGLANLLAYGLGLDPRQAAQGAERETLAVSRDGSDRVVTLWIPEALDRPDLRYRVLQSTDLIDWTPVAEAIGSTSFAPIASPNAPLVSRDGDRVELRFAGLSAVNSFFVLEVELID